MNHTALLGSAVSALLGNKVRSILTVLGQVRIRSSNN